MFQHHHSFVFSSQTNIPAIVRVGWMGSKKSQTQNPFVWKRFHRLVDILRVWFMAHQLPLDSASVAGSTSKIQFMFFHTAFYFLKCTVQEYSKPTIECTPDEQQCFLATDAKCLDDEKALLVDDATTQWVLSLLSETPSCVFGPLFATSMKKYKQRAMQTWSIIYYVFPTEDYTTNAYLGEFYRQLGYQQSPLSYQTANDLANMDMYKALSMKSAKPNLAAKRKHLKYRDGDKPEADKHVRFALEDKHVRFALEDKHVPEAQTDEFATDTLCSIKRRRTSTYFQ